VPWTVVLGSLAMALASMEAEKVMVDVLVDEEACVLVAAAEACLEVLAYIVHLYHELQQVLVQASKIHPYHDQ
jgi:hypothetical protein